MPEEPSNPWREAAERGFVDPPRDAPHEPLIDDANGADGYDDEPRGRSGCGCVLWGCLITAVVALVAAIVIGVVGYYFLKGQVAKFTDEAPAELPVVEMDEREAAELVGRLEAFRDRIGLEKAEGAEEPNEGGAPEAEPAPAEAEPAPAEERAPLELVLTADQINGLIATSDDARGRLHVRIEDGQITGDVSVPTDALPMGGGRFLNASVTLEVELVDGELTVRIVDASVKGQRPPQQLLDALSQKNLAEDIKKEKEAVELIDRIESLRVEGDRLILIAKPPGGKDSMTNDQ